MKKGLLWPSGKLLNGKGEEYDEISERVLEAAYRSQVSSREGRLGSSNVQNEIRVSEGDRVSKLDGRRRSYLTIIQD